MKKILFVASECFPFIKTGGLADVAGSLPKYINRDEFDVRVIIPKYTCIKQEWKDKMQYVHHFYMDFNWQNIYVGIMEAVVDGIHYYFIDNECYFGGSKPYGDDTRYEIEKFAYFSKAALAILPVIDFKPDVIHCHDWQTGLVPVYLKARFSCNEFFSNIKTAITIHNLKFQGKWNIDDAHNITGLGYEYFTTETMEAYNDSNFLKGGIVFADAVTTVSETYAEEIKTQFYGEGLDGLLCAKEGLCGIVNGIDYDEFNPETDKYIVKNYNAETFRDGKWENKRALEEELNLEVGKKKMMVGLVSRLTDQKGLDLIACVMEEICQIDDIQFVILGTGEKRYEDMFRYFAEKYPDKVSANICYSDALSHKIYAGCDAFLMPSLFEPCGLSQLMSLRYGTLPIVRETGGLKDTVEAYNGENSGTGFSFANYNAHEMLDTIRYARAIYGNKRAWNKIIDRAVAADFSWNASAKKYENLYNNLTQ